MFATSDSSSGSDDELIINYMTQRVKRHNIRRNFNLMEDLDFVYRFRINKETARLLTALIADMICSPSDMNNAVKPSEQLLLALRFYATGSMQRVLGDVVNVHKSTVCKIIFKVSKAIASLNKNFISMPRSDAEMLQNNVKFHTLANFPNVIGAIDCTHIPIMSPGGENAELYRNRKGFFSYNVQTICNADLLILDVVCRWPGASHDSTIFNASNVKGRLENGEFGNNVILGDGGYGVQRYLFTPLRNPLTPGEELYNRCHIRTRNPVERSYGVWKRRFPCIATKLRLSQNRIESVILATAVLHNICLKKNIPEVDPEINIDLDRFRINNNQGSGSGASTTSGSNARVALIHSYFDQLAARGTM